MLHRAVELRARLRVANIPRIILETSERLSSNQDSLKELGKVRQDRVDDSSRPQKKLARGASSASGHG